MQSHDACCWQQVSPRRAVSVAVLAVGFLCGSFQANAQTTVRPGERTGTEVVEAVCAKCHATGEKGSPRIGERADWSKRLSHGLDELVMQAVRGHGGMPARGGKAALTDNEIRNAIIYMFNPGSAVPVVASPAAGKSAGNVKLVGSTEIYLGLLPAEVLRSYRKDSIERSMHGGVPAGPGHYHVNVSLLDATTKAPISNARVELQVAEQGAFRTATISLEPVTINNAASYGNYIRLKDKTNYLLTVKVRKSDSAQPIEARFEHQLR